MFVTVCSLGVCLLLPADSSQDAVQGLELTNEENRDSLIRFENVRNHLRQRETYTLELQESVQLLNLDPTQSRQLLRRDLGNFELVTQNTRSVFLDNNFGFFNSTKPERCVWRPAEGSFFDEIGPLKNVVSTFVALGSEKPIQEILLKLGLGLDETLKFGSLSEMVHDIHILLGKGLGNLEMRHTLFPAKFKHDLVDFNYFSIFLPKAIAPRTPHPGNRI